MIGSFGGIYFKASSDVMQTFTDLKRTAQGRYETHEVIGKKPLTEFLGPELDTGSFTMSLDASLGVKPSKMIEKVLSYARTGTAHHFILGGRNLGMYNITSASATYGIVTGSGGVVSAKIDVSMKEYN